jgi:hypothetical protein
MKAFCTAVVVAQLFFLSTPVFCEVYTWTGEDGSVNYTDDLSKVPQKKRQKITTFEDVTNRSMPDITGSWSNRKNGFEKAGIYFADGGRLFFTSGESIPYDKIPSRGADFYWEIDNNGEITITPLPGSRQKTIRGSYSLKNELICLRAEGNDGCSMILSPIKDDTYKKKLRKYAKPVSEIKGRFTFAEQTVTDSSTGLVWAREGSLAPNEYGVYQHDLPALLKKLNTERYAGRSDWRLPSLAELRTLLDSVSNDPQGESIKRLYEKLNSLGFIGLKGSGYWSADSYSDEGRNCRWRIKLWDGEADCEDYPSEVLPVAGHGNGGAATMQPRGTAHDSDRTQRVLNPSPQSRTGLPSAVRNLRSPTMPQGYVPVR